MAHPGEKGEEKDRRGLGGPAVRNDTSVRACDLNASVVAGGCAAPRLLGVGAGEGAHHETITSSGLSITAGW
jgi:hypothetical protein